MQEDDALQEHSCPLLTYAVQDPTHRAVPSTGQHTEIRSVPKEVQPGESQERQGVMWESRARREGAEDHLQQLHTPAWARRGPGCTLGVG